MEYLLLEAAKNGGATVLPHCLYGLEGTEITVGT